MINQDIRNYNQGLVFNNMSSQSTKQFIRNDQINKPIVPQVVPLSPRNNVIVSP
jgi:uncharacterized membrane protein